MVGWSCWIDLHVTIGYGGVCLRNGRGGGGDGGGGDGGGSDGSGGDGGNGGGDGGDVHAGSRYVPTRTAFPLKVGPVSGSSPEAE